MARIRTVKPEFYSDESVMSVCPTARLLFIGLFNFADDRGVIQDSPIQIKARIFPGDAFGTDTVHGYLSELLGVRLINRFEHGDGKFIAIRNFLKHQRIDRPTPTNLPPPPPEDSTSPRRVLDEGSTPEGKGREGIGKDNIVSPNGDTPSVSDFEVWWKAYPPRRKTGKPQTEKKWNALKKVKGLPPLSAMLATLAMQKQSKDWLKDGGDYIPGPHRYLNECRFNEEVTPAAPAVNPPSWKPAEKIMTAENLHEFADPDCPECGGEGMTLKKHKDLKMRVRCTCTDKGEKTHD